MITFILAIYWSIFMVFNIIIQKDSDHHLLYVVSHVFSHLIHRVSLLPWLLHVFTMYMRAALQLATDYTLKVREQVCLFLFFFELSYEKRRRSMHKKQNKTKKKKTSPILLWLVCSQFIYKIIMNFFYMMFKHIIRGKHCGNRIIFSYTVSGNMFVMEIIHKVINRNLRWLSFHMHHIIYNGF